MVANVLKFLVVAITAAVNQNIVELFVSSRYVIISNCISLT